MKRLRPFLAFVLPFILALPTPALPTAGQPSAGIDPLSWKNALVTAEAVASQEARLEPLSLGPSAPGRAK